MALNLQHGDLYSPSRVTQPSATPEHHACDFCPRFFRSSDGLKQHLRSSHLTTDSCCSSPQTVIETLTSEERLEIKYVACNDCGKPFKEMDALHQHQWDCADHVRVSATPKPNKGTFERKCSLCESRFASAKDLEQHFVKNHPLIELKRREHDCGKWDEVEARFRTAWKKPQVHLYEVHRIFKVYNPGWRRHGYENYRKELKRQMSVTAMVKEMKEDPDLKNTISRDGNELRRYHGTAVKCQLGRPLLPSRTWGTVDKNLLQAHSLCTDDACSLCRIIENGFMRSKCRTGRYQRYGKGIYTSQCSSKASNYVRWGKAAQTTNLFTLCSIAACVKLLMACFADGLSGYASMGPDGSDNYKVMMICKVLAGRPKFTTGKLQGLERCPSGYHSVCGIPGEDLNYDELVVYDDDAILPDYIIFYTSSD